MPLMAFFIAVHTSIVLFQCRAAQCLASWGHGPLAPLNPPLAHGYRSGDCVEEASF